MKQASPPTLVDGEHIRTAAKSGTWLRVGNLAHQETQDARLDNTAETSCMDWTLWPRLGDSCLQLALEIGNEVPVRSKMLWILRGWSLLDCEYHENKNRIAKTKPQAKLGRVVALEVLDGNSKFGLGCGWHKVMVWQWGLLSCRQ